MEQVNKICTLCNQEHNLNFFPLRNGKPRNYCKSCANAKTRAHYSNNKDYYFDRNKKRRKNLQEKLLNYLNGKGCIDCGEKDPIVLEFDHIDPGNKEESISKMVRHLTQSWSKILEEINKCEIRCANCHKRRTAKQLNWFKAKIQ
jgi:hypothetical protein